MFVFTNAACGHALQRALCRCILDACAQMLQSGFDVNTADYDGRTALMLACAKVSPSVRSLLGTVSDDRGDQMQ